MVYSSEDDDDELPCLSERIKNIQRSVNTPCPAVSTVTISSDSENEAEFLKYKIRSTPLSQKISCPNIKTGSALIDCPEKQKLFPASNVLKERNSSSFSEVPKKLCASQNYCASQTKVNTSHPSTVYISSDSENEAEFLKFSEKIRNTPMTRKIVRPSSVKTCSEKQSLFSAPIVLKESNKSSFSEVSKKNYNTPQTKVNSSVLNFSSDSENEAEFLKFSERIRNTPRSLNVVPHKKISKRTSDLEDDDLFTKRKLKKVCTSKSQNRIITEDSNSDLLNCPEKQRLFSDSALVEKQRQESASSDKSGGSPSTSEEFDFLFPSQSESLESFHRHRHKCAQDLFDFYNRKIFDLKLPKDMPLIWDPLLIKTAGKAFYQKENGKASCYIKLSKQLLTSFDRLRDTLLHEMCHAAVWMVSKITTMKIGHGPLWQIWASRCKLILPFIECPSRCHTYEVRYRIWYQCPKCNWKRGKCKQSRKYHNAVCKTCKTPVVMTREN